MPDNPSRLDEFGLIRRYFAPLAEGEAGALNLTDDAAIIDLDVGERLVVTTDTMVAGVHFPVDESPSQIARKLLRVNLSDLAAMGARQRSYVLAAAFPAGRSDPWLSDFAAGLAIDQAEFGIGLLGGDTVATPGPLTLSITAFGVITEAGPLLRDGARPGDDIFVSGSIGDASLGLAALEGRIDIPSNELRDFLISRFRLPEPRLALGRRLIGVATAAADVSDGLIADLGHICAASSCSAVVELPTIPLSEPAKWAVTNRQLLHHSLIVGGDDYELVFAAPVDARDRLKRISQECAIPITRIGRFVELHNGTQHVAVLDNTGNRIDIGHGGYQHFKEEQKERQEGSQEG